MAHDVLPARFPVVALVASTGGLEAITAVLSRLPTEFAAAVLVLIHQDPDRSSRLTELLDRRSALPVRMARDDAVLRAGETLVTPPGQHVVVAARAEGELKTFLFVAGEAPPSRPSADLLLAALATAAGPRVIAVVLSGQGHDGATGATAVHHFGGTVIASDQATSKVFAMPSASIDRDHAVDHVVPLDEIADLLLTLVATDTTG